MKKLLTFFFYSLALLLSGSSLKAQEPVFDFSKAYQDYLFNFNQYRQAHQNYQTKRQAYLHYQTLQAKNEAEQATKFMLQRRDETIRTFLTALRLKLAAVTAVANYQQTLLYLNLDKEVVWYFDHQNKISSSQTLEEMLNLASETESHYLQTEVFAYQTLAAISAAKENKITEKLNKQIGLLEEKIAAIKTLGGKNTATAEKWLVSTKEKLHQIEERQKEAQKILSKLEVKQRDKSKIFAQAEAFYQEAFLLIKQTHSYLEEIIKEIKEAD